MLKIGNIRLNKSLILAPLHGVNCNAFRLLCKSHGAGLVYTSMIHDETILGKEKPLDVIEEERPIAVQLVGKDNIAEAASLIEDKADIIDINLGCPDKEVLTKKAGSFLIKHPDQMEKAVSKVVSAVNRPVTAKIRIGWDNKSINAIEVSKILENNNITAIAVHARTAKQGYTGKADWNIIRQVKRAVNIPVIGNGDVFRPKDYQPIIDKTDADAVMIGRGSIGNPQIFENIIRIKQDKPIIRKDSSLAYQYFREFLSYYKKYSPRNIFSEIRQHAMWLVKGIKNGKEIKNSLSECRDINGLKEIFEKRATSSP
ncbi:tRNA dihydrouridine synthase DusB [Candidatus Woesearchaeota archaeon]|nr:tRNA dihydrouridine synthase DusB [Candidatus Woesearchaeota archaeon]